MLYLMHANVVATLMRDIPENARTPTQQMMLREAVHIMGSTANQTISAASPSSQSQQHPRYQQRVRSQQHIPQQILQPAATAEPTNNQINVHTAIHASQNSSHGSRPPTTGGERQQRSMMPFGPQDGSSLAPPQSSSSQGFLDAPPARDVPTTSAGTRTGTHEDDDDVTFVGANLVLRPGSAVAAPDPNPRSTALRTTTTAADTTSVPGLPQLRLSSPVNQARDVNESHVRTTLAKDATYWTDDENLRLFEMVSNNRTSTAELEKALPGRQRNGITKHMKTDNYKMFCSALSRKGETGLAN
ncbi:hypothetical protein LTR56_007733 [Elasticomyces elasticus]|nr:hypothetical protein LTR56_007733 [Elasticomyces elasticus]KAK5759870.1 hypothetical protein LTS12_010057 [Elasticomyces elasticus]